MSITNIIKFCCLSSAVSTSVAWADHICRPVLNDKTLLKLESFYDGVRYVNLNTTSTRKDLVQIAETLSEAR
ncbi:MAG TPA: hypothetical protein PLU50_12065, partial [Pseudobdellovibrionaceae bacterium]|nr:hypothetical protein [Pseudobdellovibrionaceae bacterium]